MNQRSESVLLTRRRWDVYMLTTFLGASAISVYAVSQTGQLRFALAPATVIPFWTMLRLSTPRRGMVVPTIRSTPGAAVLLWSISAALTVTAILAAVDTYVFLHPFRAPLELYHVAMYAPPLVLIFVGACWADRIKRAQKAENSVGVDVDGMTKADKGL